MANEETKSTREEYKRFNEECNNDIRCYQFAHDKLISSIGDNEEACEATHNKALKDDLKRKISALQSCLHTYDLLILYRIDDIKMLPSLSLCLHQIPVLNTSMINLF